MADSLTIASERRWPRFSLRTLFIAVTVFACWLGYEFNWIHQRHRALSSGRFTGDRKLVTALGKGSGLPTSATAPGLLWLFGEPGYASIGIMVPERIPFELTVAEQSEFDRVAQLFPEAIQNNIKWLPPDFTRATGTKK